MYERFRRTLVRLFFGLAFAVILSVVPVVVSVSAQSMLPGTPPGGPQLGVQPGTQPGTLPSPSSAPADVRTPPPLVPGVALGDCGDVGEAMVRTFTAGRRPARPPNPATKTCEGGRIQMRVEAPRHFGHRIMDPVRVTVLLNFEPTTMIDLDSLRRGTLAFNGQEFDLVSPTALLSGQSPVNVESRRMRNGTFLLKIDLLLQSSVPSSVAPHLVFRLDLRYAMGNIRDAHGQATTSPDWRVLSTPLLGLTLSPTATAGDQFRDFGVEPVPQVLPWPTLWLLIVGIASVLFLPGLLVVRWINRHRPGRKVSREEIAWRAIDAVNASARESDGYHKPHFRRIADAVRAYFGLRSATISEVQSRLATHPHLADIVEVLRLCDGILFEDGVINQRDVQALRRQLKLIIPRP